MPSPGRRLRTVIHHHAPVQCVGVISAYAALQAEQVGFKALYLSGAGIANSCYGLPDLGMTSLREVLTEAERITAVTQLPLLVDADTGWGHAFNIARAVHAFTQLGVAGLHIEDQINSKRCGHRPNKQIVSCAEMVDRIKAAVDARRDPEFVIMARSDALAQEGFTATLDRLQAYIQAGADMVFPEAVSDLDTYQQLCQQLAPTPVLANITEFGKTPLLTKNALAACGIKIILYPLSAFRAMSQAAQHVYQTIYQDGSQAAVLPLMQTRAALYETLNYHSYEAFLDKFQAES